MSSAGKDKGKNPIDTQYKKLDTEIEPVGKSEEIYKQIVKNVETTHGPTHDKYRLKVKSIFRVCF